MSHRKNRLRAAVRNHRTGSNIQKRLRRTASPKQVFPCRSSAATAHLFLSPGLKSDILGGNSLPYRQQPPASTHILCSHAPLYYHFVRAFASIFSDFRGKMQISYDCTNSLLVYRNLYKLRSLYKAVSEVARPFSARRGTFPVRKRAVGRLGTEKRAPKAPRRDGGHRDAPAPAGSAVSPAGERVPLPRTPKFPRRVPRSPSARWSWP